MIIFRASMTILLCFFSGAVVAQADVFVSGTAGYAAFRIPAVVATGQGTLLAFAEGRVASGSDTGNIDIVLRRSSDGGRTWGPLQVVADDGDNTCGNPAPVVDRTSGRIILLSTGNRGSDSENNIMQGKSADGRRVFVQFSTDDGATFQPRREITDTVKKSGWRWYATGPGHGIQMTNGRLVVPANHSEPEVAGQAGSRSHVIISSDGGDTWRAGGSTGLRTNESTVAELSDGRLMLNSRSYHDAQRRAVSWSRDGGDTWYGPFLHPQLVDPVCQGSSLRMTQGDDSFLLFSNPASPRERRDVTVRVSRDDGQTYTAGMRLSEGFGAYSDLVDLADGNVGCLYERAGENGRNYGRITFVRLGLRELLDAK